MQDCNCCTWIWVGLAIAALYFLIDYYRKSQKAKKLEKWSLLSKDKLILHGAFGETENVPSTSPYVVKLETFLRIAKIPYEKDKTDPFGPKGKLPWISFNGHHMGDSQFIIEFLEKKFETKIGSRYSEEEKAIGTAVRIILEEHVYWGGVLWNFVWEGRHKFSKAFFGGKLTIPKRFIFYFISYHMKKMAWSQGMGRHSQEEVRQLVEKDIKAISKILGNKKYILGDEMSTDDCALFGALFVDFVRNNSPFQHLYDGECKNLKDYLIRVKDNVWPEWTSNIQEIIHIRSAITKTAEQST